MQHSDWCLMKIYVKGIGDLSTSRSKWMVSHEQTKESFFLNHEPKCHQCMVKLIYSLIPPRHRSINFSIAHSVSKTMLKPPFSKLSTPIHMFIKCLRLSIVILINGVGKRVPTYASVEYFQTLGNFSHQRKNPRVVDVNAGYSRPWHDFLLNWRHQTVTKFMD